MPGTAASGPTPRATPSRPGPRRRGYAVAARALVPDETAPDRRGADRAGPTAAQADLILTTGGTGLTARDVTPEATRAVLDKEAPGIAEALRMRRYPRFHRAALSRGVAGVRGRTLIVNLPGSTGGVRDGLAVLERPGGARGRSGQRRRPTRSSTSADPAAMQSRSSSPWTTSRPRSRSTRRWRPPGSPPPWSPRWTTPARASAGSTPTWSSSPARSTSRRPGSWRPGPRRGDLHPRPARAHRLRARRAGGRLGVTERA